MLVPNADRVLVRKVKGAAVEDKNILLPGQLKTGENLYPGEVVHAGDSTLKVGQLVYFSEFSSAMLMDMGKVFRGEWTIADAMKEENMVYIIATDDLMASDDDYDFTKVPAAPEKSEPKA